MFRVFSFLMLINSVWYFLLPLLLCHIPSILIGWELGKALMDWFWRLICALGVLLLMIIRCDFLMLMLRSLIRKNSLQMLHAVCNFFWLKLIMVVSSMNAAHEIVCVKSLSVSRRSEHCVVDIVYPVCALSMWDRRGS